MSTGTTHANDPRTADREAALTPFLVAPAGDRPDRGAPRIPEVFHLEDRLAVLGTEPAASVTTTEGSDS